ncbi:hypothetical protein HYW31_00620 [Candidatus Berkelbacteria bacterium]|nr:hypothetical protein [Candidatus Berkelbacteria bacterium]
MNDEFDTQTPAGDSTEETEEKSEGTGEETSGGWKPEGEEGAGEGGEEKGAAPAGDSDDDDSTEEPEEQA